MLTSYHVQFFRETYNCPVIATGARDHRAQTAALCQTQYFAQVAIQQGMLRGTGLDTSWFKSLPKTVFAQVTFARDLAQYVEPYGTKRAGNRAQLAADALHRRNSY